MTSNAHAPRAPFPAPVGAGDERTPPGMAAGLPTFGLGLRPEHYDSVLETRPPVDFFEIITENFIDTGGRPADYLARVRADYPVAMHGVSLGIGSTDPLDSRYLDALATLARRLDPLWISDHLCWTGVGGINTHDLLPLPCTESALGHVVDRIGRVQDRLGRQILLENVSSYVAFRASDMTEWEFLSSVAREADCLILLDVNNVFVNAFNHGYDACAYLDGLPVERIRQCHLAGHSHHGTHIVDTHDRAVSTDVWDLYYAAMVRFGPVATLIERDDHIPPLESLLDELDHARALALAATRPAQRACA